ESGCADLGAFGPGTECGDCSFARALPADRVHCRFTGITDCLSFTRYHARRRRDRGNDGEVDLDCGVRTPTRIASSQVADAGSYNRRRTDHAELRNERADGFAVPQPVHRRMVGRASVLLHGSSGYRAGPVDRNPYWAALRGRRTKAIAHANPGHDP